MNKDLQEDLIQENNREEKKKERGFWGLVQGVGLWINPIYSKLIRVKYVGIYFLFCLSYFSSLLRRKTIFEFLNMDLVAL